MGSVGNHLGKFFIGFGITVVKHDREDDGNRKARQETVNIDGKGIPDNIKAAVKGKKFFEVIQADPGTAQDPPGGYETLEGDLGAVHGEIVEDKNKGKGNEDEKVQFPVPLKFFFPASFFWVFHNNRLK
jgi:hypothetical protein